MKTLVVYSSVHHGCTGKIAKAIAGKLKAETAETWEIWGSRLEKYDLVGFGSGIYFGAFHKKLLSLIDSLKDQKGRKAFIFSTSGAGKQGYNDSFAAKLREKGFNVIGSYSCKGFDTWGPFKIIGGLNKGKPDEADMKSAEEFASGLKK